MALRRLYDRVETNIRSLNALGVSADTYGGILSPVLIKKLPPELRLIVSREAGEEWGLASLMKILEKELVARERAATKETNSRIILLQPRSCPWGVTRTDRLRPVVIVRKATRPSTVEL